MAAYVPTVFSTFKGSGAIIQDRLPLEIQLFYIVFVGK
jgi:hypothetical protein